MPKRKTERLEGRNGKIWQQHIAGWNQERIADHHNIAQQRVSQIIREVRESIPEEEREQVRTAVIERLDIAISEAFEVMRTPHYVVSNAGRIVHDIIEYVTDEHGNYLLDDNGNPRAAEIAKLVDDGPRLQAAKAIVQFDAERRKLLGLDSATKIEHSGGVRYEIIGLDD